METCENSTNYLPYVLVSLGFYFLYDIFFIYKEDFSGVKVTDATRMKKLYRHLNSIEPENKNKIIRQSKILYKVIVSTLETKKHQFLTRVYGGQRIRSRIQAVTLYYGNQWWKVLVKIPSPKNIKIKWVKHQGKDVTSVILPYLGPNLSCWNLNLCCNDLGFTYLDFGIEETDGWKTKNYQKTFTGDEQLVFENSYL